VLVLAPGTLTPLFRHDKILNFEPQKFWTSMTSFDFVSGREITGIDAHCCATVSVGIETPDGRIGLMWEKGRVFSHEAAVAIKNHLSSQKHAKYFSSTFTHPPHTHCFSLFFSQPVVQPVMCVLYPQVPRLLSIESKEAVKERPIPLNTVNLLKVGEQFNFPDFLSPFSVFFLPSLAHRSLLNSSTSVLMPPCVSVALVLGIQFPNLLTVLLTFRDIAERLYTAGYISYPRTESTRYPEHFDLVDALRLQTRHPIWYVDNFLCCIHLRIYCNDWFTRAQG
jgi:hypothetical protein